MKHNKTYLVTGGAGFIGSKIVNSLIKKNNQVVVIDNLSTGKLENLNKKCVFIKGDFSKDQTLKQIKNCHFDGVFHIGGQSSGEVSFENPEYDLNTNVLSTLKLLNLFKENKWSGRFVFASSMSVYGDSANKDLYSELDATNPKSIYAIGKLASENYLKSFSREYGIQYCSLRYFNVYGPGQNLDNLKQGMLSIFLKQILDDKFKEILVKGSLKRYRDFVYIDDVVNITINSMYDPLFANKEINVSTRRKTTVEQLINLILNYSGTSKEIKILGETLGDQFGIYGENSLLKEIYPVDLIQIEQGVKKTIEWAKKEIRNEH